MVPIWDLGFTVVIDSLDGAYFGTVHVDDSLDGAYLGPFM